MQEHELKKEDRGVAANSGTMSIDVSIYRISVTAVEVLATGVVDELATADVDIVVTTSVIDELVTDDVDIIGTTGVVDVVIFEYFLYASGSYYINYISIIWIYISLFSKVQVMFLSIF